MFFPVSVELTYGLERIAMYLFKMWMITACLPGMKNTGYAELFYEREKNIVPTT